MDSLYYFHILAFLIHTLSWVLSYVYDEEIFTNRNIWYPKFIYNSTSAGITTTYEQVIVGEKQNYMFWVFLNEALTAFSHLAALGLLYGSFKDDINGLAYNKKEVHRRELVRRTIEYTFTAAILQVALVLGAGDVLLQDVVFIFFINFCIQLCGYYSDNKDDYSYSFYFIGFMLLISEIVYVYLLSTTIDFGPGPLEKSTDFLIITGVFYILFYISFGFVKLFGYVAGLDSLVEDKIYVVLSVTTKISLSWLLIGNIFSGFYNLCEHENNADCTDIKKNGFYGDWNVAQWIIISFGILGIAGSFYLFLKSDKKSKEKKESKELESKELEINEYKKVNTLIF